MSPLSTDNKRRAEAVIGLYPERRSALIPLCHIAQSQDGYLTDDAMREIAELCDVSPAEVRGTASFYDMLHTEPVGRYVIAVCTNIACMLNGAYALLAHCEERLGIHPGQTTPDGMFTLEEAECLAGCDQAVCVQVNHRFFGPLDEKGFDTLVDELAGGRLDETVPRHGILNRCERKVGLVATGEIDSTVSRNPQSAGAPPVGEASRGAGGSQAAAPPKKAKKAHEGETA